MTMLIVLPLKSTKLLPLKDSLTKWIDTSHEYYSSSQCPKDISRLHSLHSDLANNIATSDSGHSLALSNRVLEDLVEYHACLAECEERGFPTSDRYAQVNGTVDARLQFWWRDAFCSRDGHDDDSLSECTKSHFHYERACVLWNIAALHTYKAADQDWTTKDGRTAVVYSYALAARVLNFIRTDLLKDTKAGTITADLSPECLSMCQSICLAQQQLCAYEALKIRLGQDPTSKTTHALLAKVAAGTAKHYDDALTFSQDITLKSLLPNTSKQYGKHCKSTSMLFSGRAEYLTSRVAFLQRDFGNEISRLQKVEEMCHQALEFVGGKSGSSGMKLDGPLTLGSVPTAIQTLNSTALQRRKVIVKENKSIYHEKVPDVKSLENVVAQDVVVMKEEEAKQLPVELLPQSLKRPIFASLPKV